MSRVRVPFLPAFLTILAIAFAVALTARIRSYSAPAMPSDTARPAPDSSPQTRNDAGRTPIGELASERMTGSGLSSSSASERERRYRELLNARPPGGGQPVRSTINAAKPPAPPQSALAKIGQQIRGLFSSTPTPAPRPTPAPPQLRQPPGPDTKGERPIDKDPNTDTTPPQVQQVQFDPPQVHDGDPTNVIVTATDDLAGIRGISGTVTSPNGKALQGFACQREAPESNRYIGHITIPKDAEEGLWHINFLNAADMASNSVTLAYAQSPVLQAAVLRVTSSRPDNTPPTVKNVWIDRRAMHAGERNTLYVQAEDDKSGVNLVSGVFISPSKLARIGVACHPGDGGVWVGEFSVPACLDCGDWQLEQIQLQDKASNMGSVRGDNPVVAAVKVNIAGESCDAAAPVLQSVVLETNSVPSTPEGTFIDVRVTVTDDVCGVASVSAQVVGPSGGNGQFFAFSAAGDPTWVGRMPIPRLAGKGPWKINWLQVMDKGNNLRVYYAGDPLLANAVVQVR